MKIILILLLVITFFSCSSSSRQTSRSYSYHSNFNLFWEDFRDAVLNDDKNKVYLMTKIPFIDGNDVYDSKNSLASASREDFMKNYDMIFNAKAKTAIEGNKLIAYDSSKDEQSREGIIGENNYLLDVDSGLSGRVQDLFFSKVSGIYKLTGIPYYP
jgi:hypothetical protein